MTGRFSGAKMPRKKKKSDNSLKPLGYRVPVALRKQFAQNMRDRGFIIQECVAAALRVFDRTPIQFQAEALAHRKEDDWWDGLEYQWQQVKRE